MNLQLGFGMAGAGLGLLIGIVGGAIFLVPFGIIILRSLLLALLVGGAFFLLYFVVKQFLPELLADEDRGEEESSPRIDISIQDNDEVPQSGSPAGISNVGRNQVSMDLDGDEPVNEDGSLMEELHDRIPSSQISQAEGGQADFSEDAFYAGISHLPDIGNLSNQFSEAGEEDSGGSTMDDYSQPESKSGKTGNMDPALIAKAIRTALKKEEQ